jgi:CubicO group peptidase (beta-lactamase class C family)
MKEIVAAYSRAAIEDGQAVGIGVAVIYGPASPRLFTFGRSFVGSGSTPSRPFQPDDLFEIASVTKVFTTNLLGQEVRRKRVALTDPLSSFATQLGTLKPLTSQVTLQELADFTGGFPSYAPLCSSEPVPGCLPSQRPPVGEYTAKDFAAYFRQAVPHDFSVSPPVPATSLPAPYNYSDYAIGLLGLLLAARDQPLGNRDLTRWYKKVQRDILVPLGMLDTYLYVPPALAPRLVGGYDQAIARAQVSGGQVTGITLINSGGRYMQTPRVRLRDGGGTGARATATLDGEKVSQITVTSGGTGYLTPTTVIFTNGGSTTTAEAQVIVENGQVIAISVKAGGAGYQRVPTVTISGGRAASGRDATATAHLVNGRVAYLTVDDPGEGYVPPLSVVVEPGGAVENGVPIWAPAGALTTTLSDFSKFARAALLSHRRSPLIPAPIAHGFRIAQTPYACVGPNPDLATCPDGTMRSALAWAVQPADRANGVPSIISKNGGLQGFSTLVTLMPRAGIAVVVLANTSGPPGPAENIANDILYALFAACQSPQGCPP